MCIFCERAQDQLAGGLTAAQKREAEKCETLRESRVRATILTGFLGAGKTTFLNFVLKSLAHGQRVGVVQNEFGSVSIDDELMPVERSDTETVVMPNGCLCCRVRGDLVDALKRLASRSTSALAAGAGSVEGALQLDNLIIECSGLSEVLPVAQTFFADPFVQAAFNLDGVICLCDAANFESLEGGDGGVANEGDNSGESTGIAGAEVSKLLREQLAVSDVCLLNKCDLVDGTRRDRISARIRSVSPSIKVVPCRYGKVNLGQVLKVGSFSLETALSLDAYFLSGSQGGSAVSRNLCSSYGVATSSTAKPLPEGVPQQTRSHAHTEFGSVGFEVDEEIDLDALKVWLMTVVEEHGDCLLRLKGVLRTRPSSAAADQDHAPRRRAIIQGVGGHIEVGEEAEPAPAGTPGSGKSRLVFIGKLDDDLKSKLRDGFLSTAASRSAVSKPVAAEEAVSAANL